MFAAFSAGETQIWPGDCVSSLLSGLCLSFFLHGSASFFEAKVFHTFCTPLLSLSGPSLRAIGRNRGKKMHFPLKEFCLWQIVCESFFARYLEGSALLHLGSWRTWLVRPFWQSYWAYSILGEQTFALDSPWWCVLFCMMMDFYLIMVMPKRLAARNSIVECVHFSFSPPFSLLSHHFSCYTALSLLASKCSFIVSCYAWWLALSRGSWLGGSLVSA